MTENANTNAGGKSLTRRELEVLFLLSCGTPMADIAGALGISRRTVDTHCRNIRRTLNLAGRKSLENYAAQWKAAANAFVEKRDVSRTTVSGSSVDDHRNHCHLNPSGRAA
jgi:DNA-binding CsgD family transcriptional regulator